MRNRRFRSYTGRFITGIFAGCGLTLSMPLSAQTPNPLVTGKKITLPALGKTTNVGSLPMNLMLSPNGKFAVSTNMGYREYLAVINTATGAEISQLDYNTGLDGGAGYPTQGLYYGLVFDPTLNGDGTYTLYASVETGIDASGNYSYGIEPLKLNATTGALTHGAQVSLQTGDFPAGLALDGRGNLYVAINEYFLNGGDPNELLTPGRVAILNAATLNEQSRINLISPYVKQGTLDHTFYNTDSVLHTIELLLGLPAMSQYDAVATPMTALFDTAPNNGAVYSLLPEDPAIISARTSFKPKDPRYKLVQLSANMDFTHPDSANPGLLNEILWKGSKGMNSRLPAPKHSPILARLTGKTTARAGHTAKAAPTVRDSDD